MAIIDNIVKVNVTTSSTLSENTSYGHMLIVCEAPIAPGSANTPEVGAYESLDEMTAAGWAKGDPGYDAASLVFSQKNPPDVVYVAFRKVAGDVKESVTDTLTRALDFSSDWWAIAPIGLNNSEIVAAVEWVEACTANKFMVVAITISDIDHFDMGATFEKLNESKFNFERTAFVYQSKATDYYNAALCAVCLAFAPGSETWQFKEVAGIAGLDMTAKGVVKLNDSNIGYYQKIYNRRVSFGGKTLSGEWIDIIRFRDWLVEQVRRNVFDLMTSVPKIPYTDAGIAMVESCIKAAFDEGREMGGIADDSIGENNTIIPGYTITVPKAIDLTSAKRYGRDLPGIKAVARLAGAIHSTEIGIELTY